MIALALDADSSWMDRAACRGVDPELFFPITVPSAYVLRICEACPVREQCADYAEANRERFGIWGGLNVDQRFRRARARVAAS